MSNLTGAVCFVFSVFGFIVWGLGNPASTNLLLVAVLMGICDLVNKR